MRLAAIVLEDNARGALQLVDDDTLRTVDNKGAFFRHKRQGTKIDILFLHITNGAFAVIIRLIRFQAYLDTDGGFIRQALGDTFGLVVLGLLYFIPFELKRSGLVKILYRENSVKNAFQSDFRIPVLGLDAFLKKFRVAAELQRKQMRDGRFDLNLAKLLDELSHAMILEGRW